MSTRRRDDETRTYDEDSGERRRPNRKRRRPKPEVNRGGWALALVGLLLLGGALAGGLWWRSRRIEPTTPTPTAGASAAPTTPPIAGAPAGPDELQPAIAEADRLDPGWRWNDLWAKRATVPDSLNGARVVVEAGRLLPRDNKQPPPFLEQFTEPRFDESQLAELNSWLAPRGAALRTAMKLTSRPTGRYDVQVAPDYVSTLLPNTQTARQVVTVIRAEAVRRAEAGNPGRLEEFLAMLNASRSIGDEPFLISQLVRSATSTEALRSLEQTLARTTPSEEALASAQKALAEDAVYNGLLVAWRGERATKFGLLEGLDTGKVTPEQIKQALGGVNQPVVIPAECQPGNPVLRAARAWSLRHTTALVEIARKPIQDQAAALAELGGKESQPPPGARLLDDLMGEIGQDSGAQRAFQRRQALYRSAIVALASERYRLKMGRWPLEVKELDASIVGTFGLDPCDGSPLRLRRLDDGLVVYSIGSDRSDNGGDLGDRGMNAPDVGFRLWDVAKRR